MDREGEGRQGGLNIDRPTAGITRLRFVPIETVPSGTHQQALWGGAGVAGERAHRALARVQTMLGLGSVVVPVVEGGRGPIDRTQFVPWGEDRAPDPRADAAVAGPAARRRRRRC